MKINVFKFIDRTIGPFWVRILSVPSCSGTSAGNRFLIIRPGGIGDAVLLIPVIQLLKRRFPQAMITVLAERRNSMAFLLSPAVDRIFNYDKPRDLFRAMFARYDIVIDTEQWHRLSAVLARLTNAAVLVGFATNDRKKLFSHHVPFDQDDYERDSFINLLIPLGVSVADLPLAPYLVIPETARERAKDFLGNLSEKRYVVIFPGASIPERRWGAERFGKVTERLNRMGFPVVVVGGKMDGPEGERIIAGRDGLNLAGRTTLLETAAIIEKSALLLSGDSGILHIGAGLDKPTVSLFGPGIEKKWAPKGDRHIVINKNLPCSPCTEFGYTKKCLLNARCMTEITVNDVVIAVENLLRGDIAKNK